MKKLIGVFEKIRDEPLDTLKKGCWEKNYKLKEELEKLGYEVKFKVCSFLWPEQILPKEILDIVHEDLDYPPYLEIKIGELELVVDASNDSKLPSHNVLDGKSNCKIEVRPVEFI